MNSIDIERLQELLIRALEPSVRAQLEMQALGESGLSVRVDGKNCLTSIGVWPNGCCDVDYVYVSSEQGEFMHHQFPSTEAALQSVLQAIRSAVKRA